MNTMSIHIVTLALAISVCNTVTTADVEQTIAPGAVDSVSDQAIESTVSLQSDSAVLKTGWYYVLDTESVVLRQLDRTNEIYSLDRHPIVTAKNVVKVELYQEKFRDKSWALSMQLDDIGREAWRSATGRSIGKQLAFVVNDRLLLVAEVMQEIPTGMTALHGGIYSKQELKDIQTTIEAEAKQ